MFSRPHTLKLNLSSHEVLTNKQRCSRRGLPAKLHESGELTHGVCGAIPPPRDHYITVRADGQSRACDFCSSSHGYPRTPRRCNQMRDVLAKNSLAVLNRTAAAEGFEMALVVAGQSPACQARFPLAPTSQESHLRISRAS